VQWHLKGLDAHYFGVVGPDPEGEEILRAVSIAGLPPEGIEIRPGSTAVTLILDRNGDRQFLLEDLGIGLHYMPDPTRYARLLAAGWVHLGTNSAPELVRDLLRDGVRFSIDVSTRHDDLPLDGVALVFASGPEDPVVSIETILRRFRDRGAQETVVTCGKRGAFMLDGDRLLQVRGRDIPVVDTCGAGDSFIAAFLAARLQGDLSAGQAIGIATDAAAATCGHEGGFPQVLTQIPDWLLDKYADVIAPPEN
jgi:Sugar kinases, ribokinase family